MNYIQADISSVRQVWLRADKIWRAAVDHYKKRAFEEAVLVKVRKRLFRRERLLSDDEIRLVELAVTRYVRNAWVYSGWFESSLLPREAKQAVDLVLREYQDRQAIIEQSQFIWNDLYGICTARDAATVTLDHDTVNRLVNLANFSAPWFPREEITL